MTLGLAGLASPLRAETCRLALALAMDISTSVDATEDTLQRQGLAAALIAPEVTEAFFSSPMPVALAVYEWSGRTTQRVILNWTMIRSEADLLLAASIVQQSVRSDSGSATAMGYALAFGATLMQQAPGCLFQTIDLSGDGRTMMATDRDSAYRHFPFENTVVNGLVINAADFEGELFLIPFFETTSCTDRVPFLKSRRGSRTLNAPCGASWSGNCKVCKSGRCIAMGSNDTGPGICPQPGRRFGGHRNAGRRWRWVWDVSGSVDSGEYRLQLDGLAAALQRPDVAPLILSNAAAPIRLAIYEWSETGHQRVIAELDRSAIHPGSGTDRRDVAQHKTQRRAAGNRAWICHAVRG